MSRYRGMSEGERAIWNDVQRDAMGEAPEVRTLWSKRPTARLWHLCEHCGEGIEPGSKYQSIGLIVEGEFQHLKLHDFAYDYPSGCPHFRERDHAELKAQFDADAA